jgi:glycosyltransferase involved in cell wall biosynthesis
MSSDSAIAIGWRLSSLSGWGVYGTNLALQLKSMGRGPVLLAPGHRLDLDAQQAELLEPAFRRQVHLQELLGKVGQMEFDFPVLHSLRNDFEPALERQIAAGSCNIGIIFFEDTAISQEGLARARDYDLIITGSTWNKEILEAHGLTHVVNVFQGIDIDLFHPRAEGHEHTSAYPGRFVIFSGGKLEYRKAQDIVIAAYRQFQAKHPEALLIFAWGNQWPAIMPTVARSPFVEGAPDIGADGAIDIGPWLEANGLPAENIVDLGMPANRTMPAILASADVALFPNRCEPGTNLVAMEAMAVGVPSILAANTGQLDIADAAHSYPLGRQTPVDPYPPYTGTSGWAEPDAGEAVELLEAVFAGREEAARRASAGAAAMAEQFSWPAQIAKLVAAIDGLQAKA